MIKKFARCSHSVLLIASIYSISCGNTEGNGPEELCRAPECKLTASDGKESAEFGKSVAIGTGVVVVGADGQDSIGSAYVFSRVGDDWSEKQKLDVESEDDAPELNDHFGKTTSQEQSWGQISTEVVC
jgi:hypothetical protein